jgi:putative flippase GtrA
LHNLAKQFRNFIVVGFVATAAHYGVLVGLVESGVLTSVPATLAGYLTGGVVSYWFSRRHAFASDRPHKEAVWRFVVVAGVGFVMTGFLMALLHGQWGWHYLFAQMIATGLIMLWSFVANRLWTFKNPVT